MRVVVKFLATLFDVAGELRAEVDVEDGETVAGLLAKLRFIKPKVAEAILSGEELKGGIIVSINGRDMAFLGGLSTRLRDGDEVAIFPSLVLA